MGYNYVMPALFLANVPVIYRMVDGVPDDSFYNLQIWRLATKQSSKVVVISKFVEQQVLSQDVPLSKVKKLYSLAPSRTRSIQPFIQNTELNGLVYVGQVTEHKGLWQLLYAFNEIQEYGFELIIIGSSRYDINFRQQLENWVASQNLQNKVRFLGQVDDPTEFYAKSLIHIAPSIKEEPLGMVVLEAKKVGTPSIVFPSGGLPEMVRHGIDGYICRDKTPEALVEAIEWMLSDRDRLLRMGEAARDDYESRFGRERFLQELADIYLQTLKN
jgi:glycosyltransferase involved in cell wall biosynthesis